MSDVHEVIKRINDEVFGQGNIEAVDELFHEDFVDHTAMQDVPPDREGVKGFVQMIHAAMSDVDATLERIVVDGDDVAYRWRLRGTHTGEFMGVPASDNEVDVAGNDLGVMRDGKLAELWSEADMMSVMTQIGAIEPPTG